ncbi:RNA polymerase sigma-54 factor [Clostridium folliculivorans]|uniref:RNA polymerase sigma-54 factor n=2 Tax=Clostridium folliculivorans TaxID=2886038 RepID=A0A9W6DBY7_9CLOT|nr:RNA polymerase sigma-54 factor [Clostridium folliculivorans]GKU29218.1 RNA polymerase sigma-54 factor [Clostridium folliculivorans]
MGMELSFKLTQEQRLILTQKMQLSIKILQMSNIDLVQYIEREYSENPVLEAEYNNNYQEKTEINDRIDYKEIIKYLEFDNYGAQSSSSYDEEVSPFMFISSKKSLKDHLHEQVLILDIDEYMKNICDYIIESIDSKGYLDISLEALSNEINISDDLAEDALYLVQNLDPVGIGARDLKECLKIQLMHKGILDEILEVIVNEHLEDIAENKYNNIAKKLGISVQDSQKYGDLIKTLEPKPSRGFFTGDEEKFIIPDAEIRKLNNEFIIIMNEKVLPSLTINPLYKEIISQSKDKDAESYVKDKIDSAMFLIKSIEQRKSTLHKVLERIVDKQKEYFEKGEQYLRPMTLKEIAEELDIHESTVSRAIKEKYILISRGTIKIKDMFTTGIQTQGSGEDLAVINIKNAIKELVGAEDKSKPLSDQAICDELNKKEMNISRRTVAKYREEIGIKSSSKRKRF